jgi:putative membrane-bound dehydrogenase-like protein
VNRFYFVFHSLLLIQKQLIRFKIGPQVGRMVPHPPRSMRSIDPTLVTLLNAFVLVWMTALIGCGRQKAPLSPQQALKAFQLPAGFRIELVAAEPDVVSPVAISFDERGRLFVVEMVDYPLKNEPLGRIKLLEDRDGDGQFERSTVFADNLHFPNGVMAWRNGVLVTCAPDIIYLADTDGDDRADVRRVVLTGFAETNPQLRVNGLVYGIDNWIYAAYPEGAVPTVYVKEFGDTGKPIFFPGRPEVAAVEIHQTDLRFQPDKGMLEAVAGNSEFGNTFDPWGNRFTVWNNDHVRHVVIQNQYLKRNPYLPPLSAMESVSDHEKASKVYPVTQEPSYIHDSELGHFTSACGISVYSGGAFPPEYEGNFFVCEPAHNLVHRDRLVANGPTFFAKRACPEVEFLASTDGWFRPAFTTVGPDGALYIVDIYRKVIEHPEWIPPEQLNEPDLYAGSQRGRIYCVVHESARPTQKPKLNEANVSELLQHLSNPNMWWRTTAQRLLVERGDASAVPLLKELARQSSSPLARVHALWTLEGLGRLESELVIQALGDSQPGIREQAIRLAEQHLQDSKLKNRLLQMSEDPDERVQFQLACTLGQVREELAFQGLQQIAFRHIDNKWFQLAILTAVAEDAPRWFRRLTSPGGLTGQPTKGAQEFLAQLTSIVGARQKDREIAGVLAVVAKGRSEQDVWWQIASLGGLAEGLKRGPERRVKLPAGQALLEKLLVAGSPENPLMGGERRLQSSGAGLSDRHNPPLHPSKEGIRLRGGMGDRDISLNPFKGETTLGSSGPPATKRGSSISSGVQTAALRVMTQIDLVLTPELRATLARASRSALSPETRLEDRTQAIGILGLDPTASSLPLLEKCLSPKQPQEVQVATVGALSNLRDPRVTSVLLDNWRTYTAPVREATLTAFFNDRSRLLALLEAIRGDKVQPWSLTRAMKLQLLHSPDTEIKKKANILLENSAEGDRKAVFQRYRSALQLSGNPKRGQRIFEEVCSKCHKIGNQGYEVGPDLLSVLSRPKSQLMTDILIPNLNVENGYEEYLAQTTDGQLISGVIVKQSPTAVTLRRAKGEEDTVLRSSLTNLRSLSLSAMPEDLDKSVSIEGMADLLAYLKSLR